MGSAGCPGMSGVWGRGQGLGAEPGPDGSPAEARGAGRTGAGPDRRGGRVPEERGLDRQKTGPHAGAGPRMRWGRGEGGAERGPGSEHAQCGGGGRTGPAVRSLAGRRCRPRSSPAPLARWLWPFGLRPVLLYPQSLSAGTSRAAPSLPLPAALCLSLPNVSPFVCASCHLPGPSWAPFGFCA